MVKPPTIDELREISTFFGLNLDKEELESFKDIIEENIKTYQILDSLPDISLKVKYPRDSGYIPSPSENPYNAIARSVFIKGKNGGKLYNKRVCIKDNIAVAGVPMLNGSRLFQGFIPDFDATVVTRILDEGGIIVGKTTNEDLCFSGGSHTSYPMPVRNPRNPEYMTGGSSSGNAAAIASGYCEMAVGGDQGGSIRIPASWTGIYGLKPSYGLVPYTGAFPIEPTIDHLGPMADNTENLALLLEVVAGRDGLDPRQPTNLPEPPVKEYSKIIRNENIKGLKIGVVKEGFEWPNSEEDVNENVKATAERFKDLGIEVEYISIPEHKYGYVIWTPIAIEGAVATMIMGEGLGWGWKGFYPLSFATFYSKARKSMADEYPLTVKLVILQGYYLIKKFSSYYYFKAQNLA
ncbi:MAG: amidase, partial [Sulfolobus sp.]|nr:amidase [Sulfolobus sp.]